MAGEVRFEASEADHISAARSGFRIQLMRRRYWLRTSAVALALGVGLTLVFHGWVDGDWDMVPLMALVWSLIMLLGMTVCLPHSYALLGRRTRRLLGQQRAMRGEHRVSWDSEGLAWHSARGNFRAAWDEYFSWNETAREFLLFVNEQVPHFLPKRVLRHEQIEELRATLVAHGPARR